MSFVGVSYDQSSRFSQFQNFCENQIYYKGEGAFIKQEMVYILCIFGDFHTSLVYRFQFFEVAAHGYMMINGGETPVSWFP